jgi:hypothetical protein
LSGFGKVPKVVPYSKKACEEHLPVGITVLGKIQDPTMMAREI